MAPRPGPPTTTEAPHPPAPAAQPHQHKLEDLMVTLADNILPYAREDLHAGIYRIMQEPEGSFSLEATVSKSTSQAGQWPRDVTIYGGAWSDESATRPSYKAVSQEALENILGPSFIWKNNHHYFILFWKGVDVMPRKGFLPTGYYDNTQAELREAFPRGGFYKVIFRGDIFQTIMETIEMTFKLGF